MKEGFHQALTQASKLHHERVDAEDDQTTKETMQKLLVLIEQTAGDTQSPQKTQFEVLVTLQEKKQAVMNRLHEQLARLDDSENEVLAPETARSVTYDGTSDSYVYVNDDGSQKPVTWGHSSD